MGLASLDAALAGLRVSQSQMDVISGNISNVGTEGYSRKIMPQTAQSVGGLTVGVRAETIIRNVDIKLERDLWTQQSASSFYNVQTSYLSQVEQFHGPPDKELSISSELSRLRDSFTLLSDNPESTFLQSGVINEATDTANKINDLSTLITTLRNDVQNDMNDVVNNINNLLDQIVQFNIDISNQINGNRSAALTQDLRSNAIKDLSELIEISFFERGDGVIVVQTSEGSELASKHAEHLSFKPQPLGPERFYPDSAAGIYIGDPDIEPVTFNITERTIGGRLGGLVEMRDNIFPKQMAQLDELAHKTALRFEAQGLRLFTDASGVIPSDDAPQTSPLTPVPYVGFSTTIRVNQAILDNTSLVQTGTFGGTLESGANDVIARVLDYTFGSIDHQQAIGSVNLQVSGNAPPNDSLQDFLGLRSNNTIKTGVDLTGANGYNSMADLLAAGGTNAFGSAPNETDSFTITFSDPDFGGTHVINLDLSVIAAAPTAGSAGQDLINAITGDADWANAVTDFGASVSLGADGRLSFSSRGDVSIAAAAVDPLSDVGFQFLGIAPGTVEATDPYFDVSVGNNPLTRITIGPGDNESDLLTKLQAVEGLAVEDLSISPDGFLRIRPGDDYDNPNFGGALRLVSGGFQTNNAGANAVIGAGTVPDDLNVVSALFGSFTSGPPALDSGVVTDVAYGSQTDASLTPPIPTTSFRTDLLGPSAAISTDVIGSTSLVDYAQKIVNQHAQELNLLNARGEDESTLRDILDQQLANESGVNLDEELGFLIVVQTAYAASARVITAVDEMFGELLNAIR